MYGTSVKAVEDVAKGNKKCILDIDTQVRCPHNTIPPSSACRQSGLALTCDYHELPPRCLLSSHLQGVKLIKAHHAHLNPLYVFISPPNLSSLRTRLSGRGTETDSSLSARLAAAVGELEYAKEKGAFDVIVVNDEVERAYGVLREVIVDGKTDGGDRLPDFSNEQ